MIGRKCRDECGLARLSSTVANSQLFPDFRLLRALAVISTLFLEKPLLTVVFQRRDLELKNPYDMEGSPMCRGAVGS